jgi:hypothetical protein
MFSIIDRFVLLAQERGSIPIIVILPARREVETKFGTGKDHQNITFVKNYCQERPCFFYEGASILAKNSQSVGEIASLYRPHDHIAPRGNELVAEGLYRYWTSEVELLDSAGKAEASQMDHEDEVSLISSRRSSR